MEGSNAYEEATVLIISGALEVEANWLVWLSKGSLVASGGRIWESCNGCNEVPGKHKGCKFIPFLIVNICKDQTKTRLMSPSNRVYTLVLGVWL